MAITSAVTDRFKLACLPTERAVHLLGDVYKIALYTADASLSASTNEYTAAHEVRGPGYTPGGQALSGITTTLNGHQATLSWTKPASWPRSTITARGALVYNASRNNASVAVLDFGEDYVSRDGPFDVELPADLVQI